MPLIQPASVLLSDQAGISVGRSADTPNAPIRAQAWATHITTTARFTRETAGIRQRRRQGSASQGHYPANRKARPPCYPIARSILLRGGRVPTAKELAWSVALRLPAECDGGMTPLPDTFRIRPDLLEAAPSAPRQRTGYRAPMAPRWGAS